MNRTCTWVVAMTLMVALMMCRISLPAVSADEPKDQAVKESVGVECEGKQGSCDWKGQSGYGGYGKGWKCPFRWKRFLIYLGVLHLLLTLIVFKDLRSAGPRMNGLWVVVVLMGGLPATVAYAIFRLMMVKAAGK